MTKKVTIILCCTILVIGIIVFANLNNTSNYVFANSINVSKNKFFASPQETIYAEEYNLSISPKNYNQNIIYKSSNNNIVDYDKNGNLICSNISGSVTISIFVKSSKTTTLSTTINVIVGNNDITTLENDYIEINEGEIGINKLTYNQISNINVSYENNLVCYDYITGMVTLNTSSDKSWGYDKVTLTIQFLNGDIKTLEFEVVIKHKVVLNDKTPKQIYFENLNIGGGSCITSSWSESDCFIEEQLNYDNALIIAKHNGISEYKIICSNFKYVFIVEVNLTN